MNLEPATQTRIVKNALLSLVLYALPIVLMFLTFYFTGQRPWEKKRHTAKTTAIPVNHQTAQPKTSEND